MHSQHISTNTLVQLFLIVLCVANISCDQTFDPIKESNYHFSINGYLDATADTQWVRVMPLRDSLLYEPGPINATVTLEEIGSDNSTTMNDSLFRYLEGGGTYAQMFWTTLDVKPEHTYRLTAETQSGEISSSAQVTLPSDFPTPMVERELIYIHNSIDRLGDVQAVYFGRDSFTGNVRIKALSHFEAQDTTRTGLDYLTVFIRESEDADELVGFPPVFKTQIFVAAYGPDFPDLGSINKYVLEVPGSFSNVENGLGYLAGIVSKTIPFRSCFAEDGTLTACPTEPPPW